MEDLKYYLAVVIVAVVGFLVIKKVSGCIWNMIVGFIVAAVMWWALTEIGIL